MDELHLDLLYMLARNARKKGGTIAMPWHILQALLDEIARLRMELDARPATPTPPEITALRKEAPHTQADEPAGDDDPPGLVCPECGKGGFTRVTGYKAHLRITHGIQ